MSKSLKLLFGFAGMIILIGLAIGFLYSKPSTKDILNAAQTWKQENEPWRECSFDLPNGKGKATLLIQKAHPFLAEYNEKLLIERAGQPPVTFALRIDSGGEEFINFYISRMNKNTLRLEALWNETAVNLDSLKQEPSDTKRLADAWLYLGRCDKRQHPLQFVPAVQAQEESVPEPSGG